MAITFLNALWRDWFLMSHKQTEIPQPDPDIANLPKHLSDHLARDIGVDTHTLAVLRHKWPSEMQNHPRL